MLLLNIGLQAVGMMKLSMSAYMEEILSSVNSMHDIRDAASKMPALQEGLLSSLQKQISLLEDVFSRLSLHEETEGVSSSSCN